MQQFINQHDIHTHKHTHTSTHGDGNSIIHLYISIEDLLSLNATWKRKEWILRLGPYSTRNNIHTTRSSCIVCVVWSDAKHTHIHIQSNKIRKKKKCYEIKEERKKEMGICFLFYSSACAFVGSVSSSARSHI